MAVTATEFRKMQREIKQLQRRMAKVETRTNGTRAASRKRVKRSAPRKLAGPRPLTSNKEIVAFLKREGLVRDLTDAEKQWAAEWRALPQQEKDKVNQALDAIRLDQTVAELIAEVRA